MDSEECRVILMTSFIYLKPKVSQIEALLLPNGDAVIQQDGRALTLTAAEVAANYDVVQVPLQQG
jgi:hypothetical protein